MLSEDNHVRAGDLLIIFGKNGLQVGLSSPHWRGGADGTTGPYMEKKKKKLCMKQCFDFN